MRVLIPALILSLFASFNNPSSGTAYLTCKSESGRTVFNAELQDIDGLLEKAELIVDNMKVTFDENDEVRTIFDAQTGVFTVYISGSHIKIFQIVDLFNSGQFQNHSNF